MEHMVANLLIYNCYGHNNVMLQRNYTCGNHVIAYFGLQFDDNDFNYAIVALFQHQSCQCMISTII